MDEYTLAKWHSLIDSVCIGYSGDSHWKFFKTVLEKPWVKNVCVLGVYYGRDIAYMATILESLGRKDYNIVGVDKFEDGPCNDWPEKLRGLTWEEAGFGPPPAIEKARANLFKLGLDLNVSLYCDLAENFLKNNNQLFDFIYIDTSHDYETTIVTIKLASERLKINGIIGGDDFSDQDTWGVASAVQNSFTKFEVFSNWLWLAQADTYQDQPESSISKTDTVISPLSPLSENRSILAKLLEAYSEEEYAVSVGLNPLRETSRDAPFACFVKSNFLKNLSRPTKLPPLSMGGGIALDEIYFFESILRSFKPKREFLIGIAAGWSTIAFGLINPSALLYGIDNCSEGAQGSEALELTQKIAHKLHINLQICIGSSPHDVSPFLINVGIGERSIDFAFVDGLHTNKQVFLDFQGILPYMSDAAIVAFHDVLNWNLLEGWQKIVELGSENGFKFRLLRRTTSGIGIIYRNVNEDIEASIEAFYQEPFFSFPT